MSEFHVLGEDGNRKIDLCASFAVGNPVKRKLCIFSNLV